MSQALAALTTAREAEVVALLARGLQLGLHGVVIGPAGVTFQFVGTSWGGRLGFGIGIGEHAQERVSSLVIGGQQPYRWPDSPLVRVVTERLAAARRQGSNEPFIEALEGFWNVRFPDARRTLDNDPVALEAAWRAALAH